MSTLVMMLNIVSSGKRRVLRDFLAWWAQNTPDILTGWNVKLFDVPYICRQVDRVLSTSI